MTGQAPHGVDAVAELVRVIGMSGARDVEFGYFPTSTPDGDREPLPGEPVRWWAKATITPGDVLMCEAVAESRKASAAATEVLRGLHAQILARRPGEPVEVEAWRWRTATQAVAATRRYLKDAGVVGRPIRVHTGGGTGFLKHKPSDQCWCKPQVLT